MDAEPMTFDFQPIHSLLDDLDATLYRLEETEVETDPLTGRALHNSTDKARVSRELLRAQDLAEGISTELKMHYWTFKGYRDPRHGQD